MCSARPPRHLCLPPVCPARLLDYLVRAEQECRGDRDPERLGSLEIDEQLQLHLLLHQPVRRGGRAAQQKTRRAGPLGRRRRAMAPARPRRCAPPDLVAPPSIHRRGTAPCTCAASTGSRPTRTITMGSVCVACLATRAA